MNSAPKLSVLITYFREKDLLTRCVESVLKQTRAVHEILIYDDASPEPASNYLPASPLIKVHRSEKNGGPSAGRNRLLALATGDYVHFHDADDLFLPTWCERVSQAIQNSATQIVFNEVDSFRHGQPYRQQILDLKKVSDGLPLVEFCLSHALLPLSGTYAREWLKKLGGYREELWQSEDFEFHARLALAEPTYQIISETLGTIDVRDDSRSQKQNEVWVWRLAALKLLFLDLPPVFYSAFAEAAAQAGSQLHRLGDIEKANEAFRLAQQVGRPTYAGRSLPFRLMAKLAGQRPAEQIGRTYRALLPARLRKLVHEARGKRNARKKAS